jgi:hypothetical protein
VQTYITVSCLLWHHQCYPLLLHCFFLQYTPATHIAATPSEQCYLPHRTLPVQTAFGTTAFQIPLPLLACLLCPVQYTPATHITATPSEQCYLPHRTLPVQTAFGTIDVDLSLAGSDVKKVTPNWVQCQAAAEQQQQQGAAAAAAVGVDAAAVAAAAVEAMSEGLKSGSIQLDAHRMF